MEPTFVSSIFSGLTQGPDMSPVATALSVALFSAGTVQMLRSIFGVLANVFNLLLYTTPIMTCQRIIENKSTGEFSVVPYVAALLNSVLYVLYGSPLASHGWENVHLVTISTVGVVMEVTFISIFFWYATPQKKLTVSMIMVPVILFSAAMTLMCVFLPDHSLRRTILGSFGFFGSSSMYAAPLVAVKRVVETKSVEYMPLSLSLFSCLTSAAWMAYALLGLDILLAAPNFIGVPLGILQLVVYSIYMKNNASPPRESAKVDLEKGAESGLNAPLLVSNK